ncbi:Protein of unknown function DUF3527 [Macleaya cordata]|uniref:DUF3527 domain-containing protein n=1 Tax=Macleaya cordata TaxID=56857 RepID=A0A200R4U0_MACCD|nr:Protein of unknown function DUF3527 [Macleaya cordata]
MEPVKFVDFLLDHRNSSRISKEAKVKINPAKQSLKLGDKLKIENPSSQSYAYLHQDTKHNIGERPFFPSKSSGSHDKQSFERKAIKDDELVKHMSKLPRYLQHVEREENLQKKVLNFGVLDWQRVEKWKYNEKQVPCRITKYSPSTSNSSSPFSTVGSSTLSTGSDSGTLAHPRKESSSLSSHLTSSSNEIHSRGVKPLRGNLAAVQDLKALDKRASVGKQNLRGTDATNCSKIKLEIGNKKSSGSRIMTEIRTSPSSEYSEVLVCPEGRTKASEDEYTRGTKKFQEFTLPDQRCPGRNKTIVLLLPRSSSRKSCSGASQQSESTKLSDGRSTTEANRRRSSDSYFTNEVQFAVPDPVISHSSPLTCGIESSKHLDKTPLSKQSDMNQQSESTKLNNGKSREVNRRRFPDSHRANEAQYAELNSDIPHSSPLTCGVEISKQPNVNFCPVESQDPKVPSDSAEMPSVQSKDKLAEETKSTVKHTKIVVVEPTNGPGLKATEAAAAKSRNPSPNRPSVGLGRMSRSFSFKEGSPLPLLSSTYVAAKSGPVGSDSCVENSNREKVNANSKSRSSPLRRLLDPLLKPKATNRLNTTVSFQDESSPMKSISESSNQRLDSSDSQPVKRNLNFSNCAPTNSDGLHQEKKQLTSMVQALLQVTVRNGLPWFTFAVDKNSDVLAATMKKISICGKYDCSWIYTFYSFHQVTKKSGGWMSQGSKVKSREYVPNIVGEMKVSGAQCPTFTRHKTKYQCMMREFVLVGVVPRQAGEDTVDFQQKSELAAIIVKVPKETTETSLGDGWKKDNHTDLSKMRLPECLPDEKCCSDAASTVVLLPSGVHGLPASGVPSPLIDRWKSGGSCDCGGWDVGCKLRVLSNLEQHSDSENSCSPKARNATDQFDLFVQGGDKEQSPFFSLTTYKKGIYSIDFNSSISTLQAFSVCIAFLHSRNLVELSEMGNLFEETTSQEPVSVKTNNMKVPTRIEGKGTSNSAPFPPHSPIGRV